MVQPNGRHRPDGLVLVLAAPVEVPFPLLHNGVLAPLFGLLVFGLAGGRGILHNIFAHRWFVRLGEASYALYVLHVPLWFYASRRRAEIGAEAFLACFLVALIVVSHAVFRVIEEPARRWLIRPARTERLPLADLAGPSG